MSGAMNVLINDFTMGFFCLLRYLQNKQYTIPTRFSVDEMLRFSNICGLLVVENCNQLILWGVKSKKSSVATLQNNQEKQKTKQEFLHKISYLIELILLFCCDSTTIVYNYLLLFICLLLFLSSNKILPENITINEHILSYYAPQCIIYIPSEHVISRQVCIKSTGTYTMCRLQRVQWAAFNNNHYYYDFIKTRFLFIYTYI